MKVILLDNVRKVGQKGEIIEVNDGYARNFLIKTGKAKPAVGGNLKEAEEKNKKKEAQKNAQKKQNEELFKKINKKTFVLKQKASEKGHLFGGVHKKDIAKLVGTDEKNILLDFDIKELGEYRLKINLGDLIARVVLIIEAE